MSRRNNLDFFRKQTESIINFKVKNDFKFDDNELNTSINNNDNIPNINDKCDSPCSGRQTSYKTNSIDDNFQYFISSNKDFIISHSLNS